jgi:hypothetical protein
MAVYYLFFLFHLEHVLSQIPTLSFLQIEASGGEAITFGGDVSKEADVESMMKAVSVFCLQKGNVPFHFYTPILLPWFHDSCVN